MDNCLICGQPTLIWDNDFDFEDYGREGEGVISEYHCANCGAEITIAVPSREEGDEE